MLSQLRSICGEDNVSLGEAIREQHGRDESVHRSVSVGLLRTDACYRVSAFSTIQFILSLVCIFVCIGCWVKENHSINFEFKNESVGLRNKFLV